MSECAGGTLVSPSNQSPSVGLAVVDSTPPSRFKGGAEHRIPHQYGPKKRAARRNAGPPFHESESIAPALAFLVHFLSGADSPAWSRIQAAARSLDFGFAGALASRPGLCHRSAVLCDIVSNDGARRAMQDALAGRCLGRQPEEDGQNKQQTKTHPGVFLLQIDRGKRA